MTSDELAGHVLRCFINPPSLDELRPLIAGCVTAERYGMFADDPVEVANAAAVCLANETRIIDILVAAVPTSILTRAAILAAEARTAEAEAGVADGV